MYVFYIFLKDTRYVSFICVSVEYVLKHDKMSTIVADSITQMFNSIGVGVWVI